MPVFNKQSAESAKYRKHIFTYVKVIQSFIPPNTGIADNNKESLTYLNNLLKINSLIYGHSAEVLPASKKSC